MKDKFSKWSLPLFWIFSFLIMIFIMAVTVHAEDEPSYPLYIDLEQNPTDLSLDDILAGFSSNFGDLPSEYVLYCASVDQGYWYGPHGWDYYDFYTFVVSVNPIFEYPLTLDVNSSYYYITNTIEYRFDYYTHSGNWGGFTSYSNLRHQYAYYYMAQGLGYILYGTEDEYTSTDDIVVWAHRHSGPIINTGAAIIPPEPIFPEFLNGETPPANVPPTYNATDYTWTTPPSFDGSSVESALGSIQDLIGWLANNLKEEFKNLTDNLEGFFKYIGETIQYYAGIIIETLNNFMTNFYDNMASLVQPIFEKLAYITEELDTDEINSALNNTSFIGIKNQFTTLFTNFESAFDISEPSTFTLTINIQNIRTFYNFGCRSPVIIHLDDHFIPIRTALRTFLWILISFGTVFIVERGLSDWIRGENDTK